MFAAYMGIFQWDWDNETKQAPSGCVTSEIVTSRPFRLVMPLGDDEEVESVTQSDDKMTLLVTYKVTLAHNNV